MHMHVNDLLYKLAATLKEWPTGEMVKDGNSVIHFELPDGWEWSYSDYDNSVQACSPQSFPHCISKEMWEYEREVQKREKTASSATVQRSKYHREIAPGVWIDVYDVLNAWNVTNPGLQHLIKKALAPGERGHKTLEQDMDEIVVSAHRARELV